MKVSSKGAAGRVGKWAGTIGGPVADLQHPLARALLWPHPWASDRQHLARHRAIDQISVFPPAQLR
ncbi:hypothetical protein DI396_00195 [Litorivita pollutaquae]|uniref:Uncharacterized protein n=1 Tax=Litorivita pollutaquae TaxID=2200892 RepID=A0A2V4NW55_9RHOB|nr:hypothetical protein A9Q95_12065 [Rhodobacterales bacterium 59_46_T64]PYC49336.1 hypothetical protein DI396_00195 [Litorivita pollutaquae]